MDEPIQENVVLPQLLDHIGGQPNIIIEDNVNPIPIQIPIEKEYKDLLAQAATAFQSYHYSKAAQLFHSALEKSKGMTLTPNESIYLYEQLAICSEKQCKPKDVIHFSYVILSEYNQKHVPTYMRILSILLESNEIEKAKELIDYIHRLFLNEGEILDQFKPLIDEIEKKDATNKAKELTKINKEEQRKWFNFSRHPLLRFSLFSSFLVLGSIVLAKYTYRG